jgi:hypothetical protein
LDPNVGSVTREIEEGKIKEGEVSFEVVREREGRKMTQQFVGKIDGERSVPREAKRGGTPPAPAAAAPGPTSAAAKK